MQNIMYAKYDACRIQCFQIYQYAGNNKVCVIKTNLNAFYVISIALWNLIYAM